MINIHIIDDHEVTIKGIQVIINDAFEKVMFSSSSNFPEGISAISRMNFDLIFLDIDVPGGGDTRMITRIRQHQPRVKILVCSGLNEIENCLNYLRAGANGFIHKDSDSDDYIDAVNTVLGNKTFISNLMQQEVLNMALKEPKMKSSGMIKKLTDKEYQIAKMIVSGKYTKEIALEMNLKENTISTFKKKILLKLGVKNSIELSNIFSTENG